VRSIIALQKVGVGGARTFIPTDDLDRLKEVVEQIGPRMKPLSHTERFRPKTPERVKGSAGPEAL
jgi:hypothetical protein